MCILTYMSAEEFRKLTKTEQTMYLDTIEDLSKFLAWIGKDMYPAVGELQSLKSWFQYVMSDSYES